jgi:uncharacterized tellurite resistance protein B-like protein
MIDALKRFFNVETGAVESSGADRRDLAVAATALMVQLARVDASEDEVELSTIVECAVRSKEVAPDDAESILEQARSQADSATSMYEFTEQLNTELDQTEKSSVLESIWRVAFADGRIDKYEEHLIRRIADLLHLNHREYMEARHRAEIAMQS